MSNIDLSSIQNNNNANIQNLQNIKQKIQNTNIPANSFDTMDGVENEINQFEEVEEPEMPTLEDIVYKNKLISKIQQYKLTFNELLVLVSTINLEDKSIEELEKLLLSIKEIISNRNIKSNMDNFIKAIPTGIEYIGTNFTPLKLNGYSDMLMRDKEFYLNCQEIILEYDLFDNVKTKPEYRLGYQLLLSGFLCHKINCMKEEQLNINKTVNNDLKDKYNNL